MPVFKFRISWDDDDNIFRDIEIKSGQTFETLHAEVLKAFELKEPGAYSYFESNEKWSKGREISSEVLSNKKGADKLSAIKTSVPALVNAPDKKFLYEFYSPKRTWVFLISLIGINPEEREGITFPRIVRTEGLAPAQTIIRGLPNEKLTELEDQYDLSQEDLAEGFGEEAGE